MAKVTLILTDSEDGGVDLFWESDPPIGPDEIPTSQAQQLMDYALFMISQVAGEDEEEGEEEVVFEDN
jgi:hypothetical protein